MTTPRTFYTRSLLLYMRRLNANTGNFFVSHPKRQCWSRCYLDDIGLLQISSEQKIYNYKINSSYQNQIRSKSEYTPFSVENRSYNIVNNLNSKFKNYLGTDLNLNNKKFSTIRINNFSTFIMNDVCQRESIDSPGELQLEKKNNSNGVQSSQYRVSSSDSSHSRPINEFKELRIPTPYGDLAAKEWGNPNGKHKIFCIHGWLDNAGSFDPIMPYLLEGKSQDYHFVVMDHPGTGFSAHKPPGCEYTKFTLIIEVKRIVDYLGWKNFSIIGHSLGSHVAFMYSCVYPESVLNMVSIDLTVPIFQVPQGWNIRSALSIREYFRFESQTEDDKIPVYSEAEALRRLMDAHQSSLTEKSARVLMKRGLKTHQWGYTFTRDIRLKIPSIEPWPSEDLTYQYMQAFNPNLLIIRAKDGPYKVFEDCRIKFYELFKQKCKVFRDSLLDGSHHLHMNSPEPVAKVIREFFDTVIESKSDEMNGNSDKLSPKL